ncbi:MAG: Branched-chain amino acid aminotransferase/4-amino-4-deoxychorismate lyase [Thermodesulfobacteria bacterium]|nr:aminodeoxychorismate synthase component I [Thermodesulfobacteriota bacterium]MCU4138839.1 Branched-chain amino acid aminotransferase/4-amino-4-deoxychorismate lyase [Thermodesulfobacteriota bacterium]
MNDFFIWAKADKIPYQVYTFESPLEILELKNPENLSEFFEYIENQVKKGFYACGFLSYELGYFLEEKLKPLARKSSLPLACFGIYKTFKKHFISPYFDEKEYYILTTGFKDININIEKKEYIQAIEKIKNYIEDGDVYQVNFTFKIKFKFKGDLEKLFYLLLFSQRCKYGCFIKAKNNYILSLSPELFLKKRGEILKSSPMKGTFKRSISWKEDLKLKRYLKNDIKNQAENIMIVDLIRNDLGRVCQEGSVYVSELFKIETYPTLHQMISTVKGTLKTKNLYKIIKALFPCGSITGAPKIRAMEIIRELEKEPREVYTGAIGFIDTSGNFFFNVAIRSLIFKKAEDNNFFNGEAGIGGGIVWDSIPEDEFQESILKAKFFLSPLPYFKLIETFYIDKTQKNPLLFLHYKRLKTSAKYFRFKIPEWLKTYKDFENFLKKRTYTLKKGRYKARILLSPSGEVEFTLSPFEPWSHYLKIGLVKRNFDLGVLFFHKTSFREPYNFWQKKAQEMGLNEIIFYNEEGFLLEGTISNLFVELNSELITPPLSLKILNGVLRQFLISKKKVKEAKIKIEDLNNIKAFYIGNAVRGLGKVSEWVIL